MSHPCVHLSSVCPEPTLVHASPSLLMQGLTLTRRWQFSSARKKVELARSFCYIRPQISCGTVPEINHTERHKLTKTTSIPGIWNIASMSVIPDSRYHFVTLATSM